MKRTLESTYLHGTSKSCGENYGEAFAGRIKEFFDQEIQVTISTGVALFPRDAQDISTLVKYADRAQYLAKRSGKNRVCLYTDRKELIESAQETQLAMAGTVQE